ncbi:MAG: phosphohistidine phosphatase SixA [Microcoleaceae cyanobacterium]
MTNLYFIRHGIAADRGIYDNDEDRPLTPVGNRKTRKIAQKFLQLGLKFDRILSSPLVRARQTAEILHKQGLSLAVEEFNPLSPYGNIQDWLRWYDQDSKATDKNIALVGHQPDLGNWAEILVWGESLEKLIVKKAGVIGITLPENGTVIGKSQLFWLSPPKFLLG